MLHVTPGDLRAQKYAIGQAGRPLHGTSALRPKFDRGMRLLRWQKPQARSVKRDIFPGKRHFFPGPQALHYVQHFLEFRHPVLAPRRTQ